MLAPLDDSALEAMLSRTAHSMSRGCGDAGILQLEGPSPESPTRTRGSLAVEKGWGVSLRARTHDSLAPIASSPSS